jgi:hypothetical protein
MNAAVGRPSAPPTPSDALISAVAPPSRSTGSSSRMMLIPSGTTPAARPCSVRATIMTASEWLSAPTADPATSIARLASSIRRLPNMSPSRPTTGVAMALASSVAVIAQVVFAAEACR